jgi:hypothetical protein
MTVRIVIQGSGQRLWRIVACLSFFVVVAASIDAAPVIGRIMPPAGQRGTECEVTVTGSRLHDAIGLFFEDGLIEQVSLSQINDGTVKLRLNIPADCPLGDHRVRLQTKSGLSELRTFAVIGSPISIEQETADPEGKQNNSADTAEVLPLEGGAIQTVAGVVRREDVDTYRVSLQAGEKISASLRAVRLNHVPFDPAVELVNKKGFVVATCDDHSLLQQDAMISVRVKEAGEYFLRVRESAYLGDNSSVYLLHVGRFPTPAVALPPGGAPGEKSVFTWLGDCDGSWQSEVVLPPQLKRRHAVLDGVFYATPSREGVSVVEGVPVRLTNLPIAREAEANDTADECQTFSAPGAVWGQLQKPGDVDWLRFEAAKGSKWSIRAWGRRLGSPVDLTLNAYRDDQKRQKITGNDDAEGPDSTMTVTVPEEGSFLVRVDDHQKRGGDEYIWWLEVEQVQPAMTVAVPPARTKTQQGIIAELPQGNRVALVLNATRTETAAEVMPVLTNLPAGVQAIVAGLPANSPSSLVVLEAAADAPLQAAAAAVDLITRTDEQQERLGSLRQPTEMVHGKPNRTCWRQSVSDRLPIAVVEPVPVKIELAEPVVPLVQSGRLDLRINIERAEGFEGTVRLTFPFTPPGVGAASGVNLPAKATEVVYPVNASDKAAVGEWEVAIVATVTPKGELAKTRPSFQVASQPVTLQVAKPLVDVTVDRVAGELGSQVMMVGKLNQPAVVSGKAILLGLPAKCTTGEVALQPGDTEVRFPVEIAADAPVGKHGTVVCEVHVSQGDDCVIHTAKAGEIRIDKPLPVATSASPAKKPEAKEKEKSPASPVISRRERLRQQAQAIASAGRGSVETKPASVEAVEN